MLTLIWCPFHYRVTAVASKRARSFYQECRWQVTPKHAYTLDPTKSEWAGCAAVQAQCGNLSGNELTRKMSGNVRPLSSQLAEPLWTDPDFRRDMNSRTFSPKSSQAKKKPPHRVYSVPPLSVIQITICYFTTSVRHRTSSAKIDGPTCPGQVQPFCRNR